MGKNVTSYLTCSTCGIQVEYVGKAREWTCPSCDPEEALDVPSPAIPDDLAHPTGTLNLRGGRLPEGFHEVRPRQLANARRTAPAWVMDDATWARLVRDLRATKRGQHDLCMLYWYYRAGMSMGEIATLVRMREKAVRRRLEWLGARYGV